MRILVMTNLYPNPWQPHRATFNRQQVRALAAEHAVYVIAPIAWTEERSARKRGLTPLPADRRVSCDGIPVSHPRYWYTPRIMRRWYGRFFRTSVRSAFARALREFHPELVFAPWAYPDGWAAVSLGHRAGLPVVLKLHGSDIYGLSAHPSRRRPTIEALQKADAIVAVSQDLGRCAAALGAESSRVRIVYDGIDADLFQPGDRAAARTRLGLSAGETLVLFIGNLVPVKGLDTLLRACAILEQGGRRLRFCLIGAGPMRTRLEQDAAALGLSRCFEFLGPRPHDQLPDWYRATDLFVLPSHSEGVPVVLLEAAACGTPFVASRVGGIPEIAHLGPSRLVRAGDTVELARAIGTLLDQKPMPKTPTFRRSHSEAAAELTELFQRVIGGRQATPMVTGTKP